jgi:hypothetical protein
VAPLSSARRNNSSGTANPNPSPVAIGHRA